MITNSAEETKKFASQTAKFAKSGDIFALSGDLGGGKTTFVQGFAKGFGIKERVTSPSFVIIKEYLIKCKKQKIKCKMTIKNSKLRKLIHIDLYRLKKVDEILKKEIIEYFKPENIVLIEWAEKIKDILPIKTIWIKFKYVDENRRKIEIK